MCYCIAPEPPRIEKMLSNEEPFLKLIILDSFCTFEMFCTHFALLNFSQNTNKDSYTKANGSGEEAPKETMGFIDIWLPQSKN